jgi:tetratricopeptide (TPR) repeat protein
VLGEVGWRGAFVAVSGRPPGEVDAGLERLVRRGLMRRVERSSVAGEREFAFRHVLVRDAGYARLPRADRAERHGRAAEWLEARGAGMGEQVAHHWLRALELYRAVGREPAGLADRTRQALREAADRARLLTAYANAARLYEAALTLWPPDDPDRPELLLWLGTVRVWGERGGREVLGEARDAFLAAGDRARAAEALAMMAHLAWFDARSEDRREHAAQAFALVWNEPPSRSKAFVLTGIALGLVLGDLPMESIGAARAAIAAAEHVGDDELVGEALAPLGLAQARVGDAEGPATLERGIRILEERGSSLATVFHVFLAVAYSWAGRMEPASASMGRSVHAARRFGLRASYERWIAGVHAIWRYLVGPWDEALRHADHVLGGGRDHNRPPCWLVRGRVLLGAHGLLEEAVDASEQALRSAREELDMAVLQPALAFRARLLLDLGHRAEAAPLVEELLERLAGGFLFTDSGTDLGVALAAFGHGPEALDDRELVPTPWVDALRAFVAGDLTQAAATYAEIGCVPDEARCRTLLGERLLERGERDAARRELEGALTLWSGVGAHFYARQVSALLERCAA